MINNPCYYRKDSLIFTISKRHNLKGFKVAILLIAVVDEKHGLPAPGVTRAVVTDVAKNYSNFSDKIRAMQDMNTHELLKDLGLKITWRLEYGE